MRMIVARAFRCHAVQQAGHLSGQMSKAEVELPRLFASRETPTPVLVRFTLYLPVDRKKATEENARPDEGGYHY